MNLVTPDSGLLFWMVLIFGIVFFLLWKFGFPIITDMVEKRTEHIDQSLRLAEEAQERIRNLTSEQEAILEKTRSEQARILKEASEAKKEIIAQAQTQAAAEAAKLLEKAKVEIAAEKESTLRDIRREVALLSIEMTERILREKLSTSESQTAYIDKIVDEMLSSHSPSGN